MLTPEEAWSIDKKIDDGKPAYGRVIARYWNNLCTEAISGPANSATTERDAKYRLEDDAIQCSFFIMPY